MNLTDIAVRMMHQRIDVPTIAACLDVDESALIDLRNTLDIGVDQDDIAEAMNRLAWRSIEKGMNILETGTPSMRMAFIRMMLMASRGMLTNRSPKELDSLVKQFREAVELHEDAYDDEPPDEEVGEDEAPQADTSH